jgi:streptogramin lyase
VIVGPDGAPWITDGGLNAIVRVDPATRAVHRFPLPADRPAVNLNTATFLPRLTFSGQRFPAGASEEDELIHDEDEATPDQGLSGGPPDEPIGAG